MNNTNSALEDYTTGATVGNSTNEEDNTKNDTENKESSSTQESTGDGTEQNNSNKNSNNTRSEVAPVIIDNGSNGTDNANGETDDPETESDTDDSEPTVFDTYDDVDEDLEETEMLELGVVQVNYSTEELDDNNERAIIHLFCKDPETNEPIRVDIPNFKPYFYTPKQDVSRYDFESDSRFPDNPVEYTNENGERFESIRGDELVRVHTYIPRTVGQVRDEFDHYEADIQFPDRFLVDKGISSGIKVPAKWSDKGNNIITVNHWEVEPIDVSIDLRVHTVDIEVNDRNGFPEAEDADETILCITAHDSYTDRYIVWYYDDEEKVTEEVPTEFPEYDSISDHRPDIDVRCFPSETEMLHDYIAFVDGTQADLLVGWNIDDFDAEYLINRIDKLNGGKNQRLDSDRLSKINEVWGGGWNGPDIKGRVVFDLLNAYKRTQFSELDSYRLEDVGQEELGVGKELFDGDIGDLWENDPKQLIEYNLRDVEICVELDRQQEIIDFWDEVRQFVGCRIQDAPTPGSAVDMYVLHKVSGRYVLPTKGTVESGDDYEGGSVFEPITGIEKYVTVLDLKSLYPMCMTTINASPETKVENPETYDGDTYRAPNGIHYKKDEDGIIKEMVNELLSEREEKKELRKQYDPDDDKYKLYDQQQAAVKVIMNSLYGTLGWDRFRLYDKENAAAVTATGRGVIEFTEQHVEKMGMQVTYGDTDSVMISLDGIQDDTTNVEITDDVRENGPDWDTTQLKILQKALDKSFEIEEEINEAYNEYARTELNAESHNFLIEFEKLYWRFLQAGKKKRYGGNIIWKEGKFTDDIDITGFESERSDIPAITQKAQTNVIEMLVRGEDIDEIRNYIAELIDDYKNGEYSFDEVGIPSGIGQPLDEYDTETAHVRGAKYANEILGTNFGQATKPKRVYLERVHQDFFTYCEEELGLEAQTNDVYRQFKKNPDVICFAHEEQVPSELHPDWEKMLNKTLQKPLSRVLKAVDLSWAEVKEAQTQTGLGQFM